MPDNYATMYHQTHHRYKYKIRVTAIGFPLNESINSPYSLIFQTNKMEIKKLRSFKLPFFDLITIPNLQVRFGESKQSYFASKALTG